MREAISVLRQATLHPAFADVGPLWQLPVGSRVLARRDGYRELFAQWQVFHRARRPLFESLQHTIEVRDVATLYEHWAFFTLVEEIAGLVGAPPTVNLRLTDEGGLGWNAEARFGPAGYLVYNHYQSSYSVPLRPDFMWLSADGRRVALDAKFRLERRTLESVVDVDDPETTARRADLYKMHTYRDALGVDAAVVVYPGEGPIFYDRTRKRLQEITLRLVLTGDVSGVGALPLRPGCA